MDARTKEAIRYLGYGRHAVDDHTLKLVESCFEELSFWEIWISTVKIFIKI